MEERDDHVGAAGDELHPAAAGDDDHLVGPGLPQEGEIGEDVADDRDGEDAEPTDDAAAPSRPYLLPRSARGDLDDERRARQADHVDRRAPRGTSRPSTSRAEPGEALAGDERRGLADAPRRDRGQDLGRDADELRRAGWCSCRAS